MIVLRIDGISQEFNETFSIEFIDLPTQPASIGVLNGTIIDDDGEWFWPWTNMLNSECVICRGQISFFWGCYYHQWGTKCSLWNLYIKRPGCVFGQSSCLQGQSTNNYWSCGSWLSYEWHRIWNVPWWWASCSDHLLHQFSISILYTQLQVEMISTQLCLK